MSPEQGSEDGTREFFNTLTYTRHDSDGGDDVLYGGDGDDFGLDGGPGDDVFYGGAGNDHLGAAGWGQDKLYCGRGKDKNEADTNDYVSSSCEEGKLVDTGGPPLILLAGAALLLSSGLMLIRYVIGRAS